MNVIIQECRAELVAALARAGVEIPQSDLPFQPCGDLKHGDYQSNIVMSCSKRLGKKPRDLAEAIVREWQAPTLAEISIAGPGFLNFRLTPAALVRGLADEKRELTRTAEKPKTYVLDFSAPNVAKAMHVGHIRSTILGDSLARVLRYLGHKVITDNHIGDWGTQFGKLIIGYEKEGNDEALKADPIGEMERLYRLAHKLTEADETLQAQAREELRKLQDGDPKNLALWERFRSLSQEAFDRVYARLNVHFDHTLGESFYNPMLKATVQELLDKGIARESEGAVCVFFDGVPGLDDKPFLIQKSDGAALYATTDIATLNYRLKEFHADAIWYVTDLRQSLHFQQLFATARRIYPGSEATLDLSHVGFGSILGPNKTPLKTREGDNIKLEALLEEAVSRARALLDERRTELPEEERSKIAELLGISSVKYADLVQNRHLDYVFDWNKLLAFDGNTAPYLMNAYVRIQSIYRKAELPADSKPRLGEPTHEIERELMLTLLRWEDIIAAVAQEQRPHHLCFYLFSLAQLFHSFFEACPVLKSEPALKEHRLALCALTRDTLKKGCELLGIPTLERM